MLNRRMGIIIKNQPKKNSFNRRVIREIFIKKPANGGTPASEKRVIVTMRFQGKRRWESKISSNESLEGCRGRTRKKIFNKTML